MQMALLEYLLFRYNKDVNECVTAPQDDNQKEVCLFYSLFYFTTPGQNHFPIHYPYLPPSVYSHDHPLTIRQIQEAADKFQKVSDSLAELQVQLDAQQVALEQQRKAEEQVLRREEDEKDSREGEEEREEKEWKERKREKTGRVRRDISLCICS